ncbi:Holliday junction branch migration protein RuvA [Lentilactobacillus parafarraginis]|jgi:Holliday junction DNA helicase RuvA|uniref:Holliday junction branch migration complex subunit RuvA n=2 Tax=Lentilactobacillus parafarraginis TaxID=390842 RepID=A0A0R1YTC5_9LACO|nr:Holliday junction branch migration protein RuvA [Lentilactobacillus parafarraginis]KRM45359.1 Holliday junction DNA helicase RuvA [Lentilactobacillus parafarraginis DSM 18390 = JCM 14109]TLQ20930.1 Holliday junction branch migration protein RuvA [Lentilactobacillus parafarraginis]
MYEFFEGQIVDITPASIVLLVNGVGYLIYTADPYRFKVDTKKTVRVYVYQAVSDSAILLYGFYDADDKKIFQKLLAVSGIGPKSALAILAGNDRSGLINAINNRDVKFLTKFPGVGKKTAQQIILDLQGKVGDFTTDPSKKAPDVAVGTTSNELADAMSALEALGYSTKQITSIQADLEAKTGLTTDEYLSLGLKLLMH